MQIYHFVNFRMNYIFLILAILATIQAQSDNKLPFCNFCDCNNVDNLIEVTCKKDISHSLFDVSKWMNQTTNVTYPYKSLVVQNSPILTLEKQFPATNITLLNLSNNSIVNISDRVFSNLQNMETLILSYNNIKLLHPNAFEGVYMEGSYEPLRALKYLHLDHNRLHSLDADVFQHTDRVEVLTLSHNPFKTIDQQTLIALTSLPFLKKLDLSYTQLATLPDNFLHTPKYLNFLDLSGNLFDSVPTALEGSHSLTTLFFDDNPIVNLTKENGFPEISTLKVLHMSSMSKLLNISSGALSQLYNVEELYIFGNIDLFHIDKSSLSSRRDGAQYETWPPVKKLYLQNNKLSTIDMQLLLNWNDLTALDLTNNPWTCECENQWIVDELMPIYLKLDEDKAKDMKCAAPIEMATLTFFDVYQKQSSMRCLDAYGHRPEKDGALLVGILAGVLITIPLVLFIIYSYQRHWFGVFDGSPASYTRQFYKRTVSNDEYF